MNDRLLAVPPSERVVALTAARERLRPLYGVTYDTSALAADFDRVIAETQRELVAA